MAPHPIPRPWPVLLTLYCQLGRRTLPGRHHILRYALVASLVRGPHIGDQEISTIHNLQSRAVELAQFVQLQFDVVLLPN